MYMPVYLQAWTRNPADGQYWVVEKNGSNTRPVGRTDTYNHLKEVLEREELRIKNQKASIEQGPVVLVSSFTEIRLWLEWIGWPSTYKGVHRDLLRLLTTVPTFSLLYIGLLFGRAGSGTGRVQLATDVVSSADDERKIAAIAAAVEKVVERCEQTARTIGRTVLCWLRSVRSQGCYAKLFTFVSKETSRRKYMLLFRRFIVMVFRAYRMDMEIRQRVIGIRFKRRQAESIARIWDYNVWAQEGAKTSDFWKQCNVLYIEPNLAISSDESEEDVSLYVASNEEEEEEEEGGGGGEDEDNYNEQEDTTYYLTSGGNRIKSTDAAQAQRAEVIELLFGLIMLFCTEDIVDGRPASTLLVYFSGILGFSADCKGYLPAKSYTSYLAGLVYIQRLLFLEYAIPTREYPLLGISPRPRVGQVARLQKVRQKYTVLSS
jgi:hypothetical protein